MTDFSQALAHLVSSEMAHADAEKTGMVIERLLASAAFTMAIGSRGDETTLNNMLEGASAYLWQEAAAKIPLAKAITSGRELRGAGK